MTRQGRDYGYIKIRGARENSLQNVDVDIPKRALTVVSGVSGSGKSSLVFNTLAAESQRQLNETFSTFVQSRLPSYGQPDVDTVENLSAVVVLDQKQLGGSSRSTVGTVTDIGARLRLLFSRCGSPFVGYSNAFSFNDPAGMCSTCQGLGVASIADESQLVDRTKSLDDGALTFPAFAVGRWHWKTYALSGFFDRKKPLSRYTKKEWNTLMHAERGELKAPNGEESTGSSYEGVLNRFNRLYLSRDVEKFKGAQREAFERIVSKQQCPNCKGSRLNDAARSSHIKGRSIADVSAVPITQLDTFMTAVKRKEVAPLVAAIGAQVSAMVSLGLGYLSLDRASSSLSGGESQRLRMVQHLTSSLNDMLYIFDEPTVGLHASDVDSLLILLQELRDKGNTVVVVEHDPAVMAIADHCIDMGPGAGSKGGEIVFEGTYAQLKRANTKTGNALRRRVAQHVSSRRHSDYISIRHAATNNLRRVSVEIPRNVLTVLTGVAGSGKSSLAHHDLLAACPDAIVVDQKAIRGSRRSSPLTYTGVADNVRRMFADRTGEIPSMFSPNSDGGCTNCNGAGVIFTDLAFMEGVSTPCEECDGRRFRDEANQLKVAGRSIADVYEMSVNDALGFFDDRTIVEVLNNLSRVGIAYLTLGQNLTTLSGGERQRLRLAKHLGETADVYVLDEPTTGLHLDDVNTFIELLNELVDDQKTVVVIEHNLDVIAAADWVIDLGPGAGDKGGRVVFEGTPDDLVENHSTTTGRYLRDYLQGTSSR